MKILFTGCGSRHNKRADELTKSSINRINDSEIIVNSLESMGHIVEKRKIKYGEDLSVYDRIIVGLGSFSTFTYSSDILNSFYALSFPNTIIFNEGKKVIDRFNGYKKINKNNLSKKLKNGEYFYNQTDNISYELILDTIQDVINGKYKIILPSFKWGNKKIIEKIFNTNSIMYADLSSYVLDSINIDLYNYKNTNLKNNSYFYSSLENFNSWINKQNFKWPVDLYGPGTKDKSKILNSEYDVFIKSSYYKAILAPPYDTVGSGWFKIRYLYSALNDSVIIADNKDLISMGIDIDDIINVEKCTPKEYEKYSKIQKNKILEYFVKKEDFDLELNKFIQ